MTLSHILVRELDLGLWGPFTSQGWNPEVAEIPQLYVNAGCPPVCWVSLSFCEGHLFAQYHGYLERTYEYANPAFPGNFLADFHAFLREVEPWVDSTSRALGRILR